MDESHSIPTKSMQCLEAQPLHNYYRGENKKSLKSQDSNFWKQIPPSIYTIFIFFLNTFVFYLSSYNESLNSKVILCNAYYSRWKNPSSVLSHMQRAKSQTNGSEIPQSWKLQVTSLWFQFHRTLMKLCELKNKTKQIMLRSCNKIKCADSKLQVCKAFI